MLPINNFPFKNLFSNLNYREGDTSTLLEFKKCLLNSSVLFYPSSGIDINDILYLIRQFDTLTDQNIKWHEWISSNVLGGIQLRGENIKADEFSGSKFKLYTIIDCAVDLDERAPLLYDMSTVSTLGSSISTSLWAPSKQYYDELMGTKISFFNNWDAICLFDSFTCIGTGQLNNEGSVKSWDYTYFRIYLYRLFFKYNLYRYNSSVQDDPVKLRNEFESFLSDYNLSNISFNFMANEIFNKTGDALDITLELDAFQSRINRLSTTIQEKKQSKTNNLLKIVTFLGALSSIQPFLILLDPLKNYLNLSSVSIYSILILLILTLSLGVLYYLMPELFQQFGNRVKKIWK